MKKLINFLTPTKIILLAFTALILFVPVLYIYYQPERTNYLPGEKQIFLVKAKMYPGTIQEYAFQTEGDIDLFFGILERNYIHNLIGPGLILGYYSLSSGLNLIYQGVRPEMNDSRKK